LLNSSTLLGYFIIYLVWLLRIWSNRWCFWRCWSFTKSTKLGGIVSQFPDSTPSNVLYQIKVPL